MLHGLSDIKHLLIIRLSSLGDIILTTPVIRAIKEKYPDVKIDFLVKPQFKDVVICNDHLDNVLLYDRENLPDGINNYDLILDLQKNRRSKRVLKNYKGKVVKYNKPQLKKFLLVNFKINLFREIKPVTEMYAENLQGISLRKPPEIFTECRENVNRQDVAEADNNKTIIGVCPGSQHFTKMWPLEYYIKLCSELVNRNFSVYVMGGESDRETGAKIKENVPAVYDLTNNNDLFATLDYMKKCSAVVCNDSGMMHTATACGVPVAAIFGSTVKEFGFAPYSDNAVIIENEGLKCRPCSHIGRASCPEKHFWCMKELTPEIVLENLLKLVN